MEKKNKKTAELCVCLDLCIKDDSVKPPSDSQNCILCDGWGCQFLKFMAESVSAWEVGVWCGSGRLSAVVHLWQALFSFFAPILPTFKRQLHKSDASLTTNCQKNKKKRGANELWWQSSDPRVHVILLLSGPLLIDTLSSGPTGAEGQRVWK